MLTSVNELAKQLATSKENLAEEKDKVEQIKKWEEREAKLDSEFISLEQKYKQACSAQENFKSEMPSKLKANEETLLNCWHKWIEDKQNLVAKEELSNFSVDEIVNWYQKHGKSLDSIFIEKKSQSINKYKKELRKIIEDFNQTKYLITGEENSHKQNVNKHLQKKQRLLEDIEKHKKTKETIKPTNKNSEEKVNMFDLKFPDEELPEVGELFSDKNKRYLSITKREEVTQAKKCAMRLNADLVVSR
jgi:DNA repair exonuclease SbcCD ATPase subunit